MTTASALKKVSNNARNSASSEDTAPIMNDPRYRSTMNYFKEVIYPILYQVAKKGGYIFEFPKSLLPRNTEEEVIYLSSALKVIWGFHVTNSPDTIGISWRLVPLE